MNETNLAEMAVKATNVIKEYNGLLSPEIITKVLDAMPVLTVPMGEALFFGIAKQMGIVAYDDINDIVDQLKTKIDNAADKFVRSNWLQSLATYLYIGLSIAANFLPPAWKDASKAVISGYEALYGGEG